jgi:hypothetical protein
MVFLYVTPIAHAMFAGALRGAGRPPLLQFPDFSGVFIQVPIIVY